MIEFDGTGAVFAAIGTATLAAAVLPKLLKRAPVSMPMVFLAAGVLFFTLIPRLPDPLLWTHDAERAWECPCHGSRFDLDGSVIQGPANRPLARRDLPADERP